MSVHSIGKSFIASVHDQVFGQNGVPNQEEQGRPFIGDDDDKYTFKPFTVQEVLDGTTLLPGLYNSRMVSEYVRIYEMNMMKPPRERRFALYRWERDGPGWGNRLTSTMAVFLFSLLTGRILVVQNELFTRAFDPPVVNGVTLEWHIDKHYEAIMAGGFIHKMQFHTPFMFDGSKDLNETLPANTIQFPDGHGAFVAFLNNLRYASRFEEIFPGFSNDTLLPDVQVGSFLFGRPTEALKTKSIEMMAELDIPLDRPLFVVQFRTFFDVPSIQVNSLKNQDMFWSCMHSLFADNRLATWFEQEKSQSHNITIFYTSDESKTWARAVEEISGYGNVVIERSPVRHTSSVAPELTGSILHWFVMSLATGVMTTGTSFALTAVYRNGAAGIYRDIRYIHEDPPAHAVARICEDRVPPY